MRLKLAPVLFIEENPERKGEDMMAPSNPSKEVKNKSRSERNVAGQKVMSFAGVLRELPGVCMLIVTFKINEKAKLKMAVADKISHKQNDH